MTPARTIRVLLALAMLTFLLALGLTQPASAARAKPATPVQSTKTFGVYLPGVPGDLAALSAFATQVGRKPNLVMWFEGWAANGNFPAAAAANVASTGATPQITWEPWDYTLGTPDQPLYALDRIADGTHDDYIYRWAEQVRAYGRPVQLRFAHEMNGTWYPWAEGVNGNQAGDYVAAWTHVVSIFRAVGATNAAFIWAPNVPYPGSVPLDGLFPGDDQLAGVALDGYNFGTSQVWSSWISFTDLFASGVGQLDYLSNRPLTISEVGSAELGGSKAAWVTDMFGVLAAHPEVAGFTWFNENKETDWRVASSKAALTAFRAGLTTY